MLVFTSWPGTLNDSKQTVVVAAATAFANIAHGKTIFMGYAPGGFNKPMRKNN